MKRIILVVMLLSAFLLASCSGTAAPASTTSTNPEIYVSSNLDISYENALSARLQLTLGSLKLAETNSPITADQAKVMLPLWEGLLNMTRTGNNAQAEVNAVLEQIEAAFTPDQLTAIRDMKLTSADIQTWGAANGVASGSGTGEPDAGQGSGSGLSAEERATKQAAAGNTSGSNGSNGVSTVMLNSLISYLQGLAQ